jgi:hypothetical protein
LRLQAEIGWLPEVAPALIRNILLPRGIDEALRGSDHHPLAHANLVAAGLESLIHTPVQNRAASQLNLLATSVQKIEVEACQVLLNNYRSTAGFPSIEMYEARDALSAQFRYYKDVGLRFLSRYARNTQEELFGELLESTPVTPSLVHEWIDAFQHETKAELDSLIENVEDVCKRVELRLARRATAVQVSAGIDELIKSLQILDRSIYPIWRSHLRRGLPYWRFSDVVILVRNLIIRVTNEYQDFHRALQHVQALLRLKSLDEDLKRTLNQDQMQVIEGLYVPGPQHSPNILAGQRTQPSDTPVATHEGSGQTRWIGRLVTLAIVIWIGTAIFGGDDPVRNAGQPTEVSSSVSTGSVCAGFDFWFQQTNSRYDQSVSIYNNLDPYPLDYELSSAIARIEANITAQERATRPSSADAYNRAVVRYMEFMADTLSDPTQSGLQWDSINDRLLSDVQSEGNALLNRCG